MFGRVTFTTSRERGGGGCGELVSSDFSGFLTQWRDEQEAVTHSQQEMSEREKTNKHTQLECLHLAVCETSR